MITVDDSNPTPPFEQIRSQLAGLISVGTLPHGERLPTVRQLAADLRLAPGTVARAYSALEADGLIETRRGGGTRVSSRVDLHADVQDAAAGLAAAARVRGLSLEEAVFAVRDAWSAQG
jgi:GntR family transcriptional regulator